MKQVGLAAAATGKGHRQILGLLLSAFEGRCCEFSTADCMPWTTKVALQPTFQYVTGKMTGSDGRSSIKMSEYPPKSKGNKANFRQISW
ncbi:hypothetical protein M1D96_21265 [Pseudomonas sp. D1-3]